MYAFLCALPSSELICSYPFPREGKHHPEKPVAFPASPGESGALELKLHLFRDILFNCQDPSPEAVTLSLCPSSASHELTMLDQSTVLLAQARRGRAAGRQTSVTREGRNGKNDDRSEQWPGSPLSTLYLCSLTTP